MSSRETGHKAYALAMFAAVSVLCGLLIAGLVLPFAALFGGVTKAAANGLESLPAGLEIPMQPEGSKIYMADGTLLGQLYAENRQYVAITQISGLMRQAQVAIEDNRFYEHGAIDLRGMVRAFITDSSTGSTQGGSTLTQQYVKLVQVEAADGDAAAIHAATEQTLTRKIRELRYAVALEKRFSKDEILTRYLNIAYYGDGAYGVQAAAEHYFGVSAAHLNLAQSAMLAGLVQNPVATDPVHHPVAAINRRNVVIDRMLQLGLVTPAAAKAAKATTFDASKVTTPQNGCLSSTYPILCDYVVHALTTQMTSLGSTPSERLDTLKRAGLTIKITVSKSLQEAAQEAILYHGGGGGIDPTDQVLSTAVLLEAKTGHILALAQSRPSMGTGAGQTYYDYAASEAMGGAEGYQAGSTFKAFTIAAALNQGMTPNQRFDSPSPKDFTGTTYSTCSGTARQTVPYRVSNEVKFGGGPNINMYTAAQYSVNTYFIQLEEKAGLCNVVKTAQAMGAKSSTGVSFTDPSVHDDKNLSFTLGTQEVTPLSMTEGYATLANQGIHCNPTILDSVTTKAGKSLTVPGADCQRVISADVANAATQVLKTVMTQGTGKPDYLPGGYAQAGKTGTTESNAAVWFAGYTPDVVGTAMIAVDKMDPIYRGRSHPSLKGVRLRSSHTYLNGSGSGDAGPIWKSAMLAALQGRPKSSFASASDTAMNGQLTQVPSVYGLTASQAVAQIQAAGFSVRRYYQSSGYPAGTVLSAWPSGMQNLNTTIYVAISSGTAIKRPSTSQPRKSASTSKPTSTTTSKPTSTTTSKPTTRATSSTKPGG